MSKIVEIIKNYNVQLALKNIFSKIDEIIRKINFFKVSDIENVDLTSLNNDDALIYESSTQLWKNKTISTALGYTPENIVNKSNSYTLSSTTTYPNTKALVDGLDTKNYIDTLYSTKYYVPYLYGESASQRVLTSNTSTQVVPFYSIFKNTITNISIEITTAQTSSNVRFQIYNGNKTTFLPTTLLMDSGLIASTTNGIKTITGLSLNLQLDSLYFMVISTDTNNVGVRGVLSYGVQQFYGSLTKFLIVSRSATGYDYMGITNSVPSTFNTTGLVDSTATFGTYLPTLFFR